MDRLSYIPWDFQSIIIPRSTKYVFFVLSAHPSRIHPLWFDDTNNKQTDCLYNVKSVNSKAIILTNEERCK